MNRRTFNVISLAAVMAPLPQNSIAQRTPAKMPGYQIAEIEDGRLATAYGGMATPQSAVGDDTLFQVASCSKTVTSLAILTLVRDGLIDLDLPANRYLKRWQLSGPRGETTTIAELMSHTAGTTVHGFSGYGPDEEIPSLVDILEGSPPTNSDTIRTRRRLFPGFRYSGGGTMVLQLLIEDVTGTNFSNYTSAQVLTQVGARRATFAITPAVEFAHGYYEDGRPLEDGFRRHPESAAAGLWATASDLAKILQAILQSLRGSRNAILPKKLARRMVTPMSGGSGLGVFVTPGAILSHSGRNYGFDSIMTAEMNTGIIRAAVTNRNGAIESFAQKWVTG